MNQSSIWPRSLTPPVLITISSSQSPLLSVTPVRCMDTANFINFEVRVCYSFLKHNIFRVKAKESFVVVWIIEEICLENQQCISSNSTFKNSLTFASYMKTMQNGVGSSGSLELLLFTRLSWDCTEISLFWFVGACWVCFCCQHSPV